MNELLISDRLKLSEKILWPATCMALIAMTAIRPSTVPSWFADLMVDPIILWNIFRGNGNPIQPMPLTTDTAYLFFVGLWVWAIWIFTVLVMATSEGKFRALWNNLKEATKPEMRSTIDVLSKTLEQKYPFHVSTEPILRDLAERQLARMGVSLPRFQYLLLLSAPNVSVLTIILAVPAAILFFGLSYGFLYVVAAIVNLAAHYLGLITYSEELVSFSAYLLSALSALSLASTVPAGIIQLNPRQFEDFLTNIVKSDVAVSIPTIVVKGVPAGGDCSSGSGSPIPQTVIHPFNNPANEKDA